MKRLAVLLGLVGLGAAIAAIVWSGYDDVLHALSHAGWGILATGAYRFVPLAACVIGWRVLVPSGERPPPRFFLYLLWLRSSIDNLMPAIRIGGDIAAVRVMIKRGMRKETAIASTIVEVTLSLIALLIFGAMGMGLFLWRTGNNDMGWQLAAGLCLSLMMIALFMYVQHEGFFNLLSKISKLIFGSKAWLEFVENGKRLDTAIRALYSRRKQLAFCSFWELMTWILGSGEVWLSLYFLGHPVSLVDAVIIEALVQASVNIAFIVPAGLGVQDMGFLLIGRMLGLPPDIAAALAVIRRCGDLLVYIPGLITWQVQEGYWFLRRKQKKSGS